VDTATPLRLALTAFTVLRTPSKITAALQEGGRSGLEALWQGLRPQAAQEVLAQVGSLQERGIQCLFWTDEGFPSNLIIRGKPAAPLLFYKGDPALFHADGVGMCGSRAVSEVGVRAASGCGETVSALGMTVISGYAKGVDTETHLAALRTGGRTVIVLAEGFDHFRVKRAFQRDFDPDRTLVVSQFPPSQPWSAHAAMARNSIIFGLGLGLVVIEAGERGGTLAAGEGALRIARPVFVLDFGKETPPGNRRLLEAGAVPVNSVTALHEQLQMLKAKPRPVDEPSPRLF
jgi:DNA processing protein